MRVYYGLGFCVNLSLILSRNHLFIQLNQATSWIDGNFIYGRGEVWSSALRAYVGGKLATQNSTVNFPALNSARIPLDNYPSPTTNQLPRLENYWSESLFIQPFSRTWKLHCRLELLSYYFVCLSVCRLWSQCIVTKRLKLGSCSFQ